MTPESFSHVLKGQIAREMGDAARARVEFSSAAFYDPSAYVLRKIREAAPRAADLADLAGPLEKALEAHPGSLGLMRLLGETWVRLGQEGRAMVLYQRILVLDPADTQASAAAAELSRRGGDLSGAGAALSKALTLSPQDANLLYRLAQVRLESGKSGEAENLFKKARAADPSHILSVLALGVLYRNSERVEEAERLYGEFLARHPDSLPLRRERAEMYASLSRWIESEADYLEIIATGFGRPGDFRGLGAARLRQGRALEALEIFNEGLERNPESSVLRFYKVQALGLSGGAKEALALLEDIRSHPGDEAGTPAPAALSQQEGLLRYRLDDSEGALAAFRRAFTEDPQSGESAYAWGVSAALAKKNDEAQKAFSKALELEPDHVEAGYQMGLLYAGSGDADNAERCFRRVLDKDAKHPEALNALGYSLAERGVQLEEASRLIKRALEVRPQSPAYLDSLAWVHFKQGRLKEAESELRQASARSIEEGESDPVIEEHLKEVQRALGLDPANPAVGKKTQE